ncbi:MAG: hypothetical protein HPY83_12940 [Anaerolineae bacterium]|nr:hypothetical protein [Anaerolineae bacterium]
MRSASLLRSVAVIAACLVLIGCGQVRVSQAAKTPEARRGSAPVWPEHDLAFLGAEIDPPLAGAIGYPDGDTRFQLLVALENRGRQAERDVIVEAWLRAPAAQGGRVLISGSTIAPYLAPGQAEVVRLPASGVVPILPSYILEVSVRPGPQETYLDNNSGEYEIAITPPGFPLG